MRLRADGWWLIFGFWLGLSGAAGAQTYPANPATLGAIPDAVGNTPGQKWVEIPVSLPPGTRVENVKLSLTMTHTWVGDLVIYLRTPFGSQGHMIFGRVGAIQNGQNGDSSDLNGTYVFHNAASGNFWTAAAAAGGGAAVPGGEYRTTDLYDGDPTTMALSGPSGTWYVEVFDHTGSDVGAITAATLTLTTMFPSQFGGPIPDATTCAQPGPPRDVAFEVPPQPGTLRHVEVSLSLEHSYVGHLTATLIGPDGTSHTLFGRTGVTLPGGSGASSNLDGIYTFSDLTSLDWWLNVAGQGTSYTVPSFRFRTSDPGGLGATGGPTSMDPVFAVRDPAGVWHVRVTDTCPGETGELSHASLLLVSNQAHDDTYAVGFQQTIGVPNPGVLANDVTSTAALTVLEIVTQPTHGSLLAGAGGAFIYAPATGYAGPDSFSYRASTLGAPSNVATVHLLVAPPAMTSGADSYTTSFETALVVPAPGVLANDTTAAGLLSAVLVTPPTHGTATLAADGSLHYVPAADFAGADAFTYRPSAFGGLGPLATVTVTVPEPTTAQPPKLFDVVHASGSRILLRWNPPRHGPAPTAFVLSGGAAASQTLAEIALPATPPVLAIDLPPGVLYLRMATQTASGTSGPSNELRVPVLVAEPPSAPAALTATVDGGALTLTWKDTYFGGEPGTMKHLDVTGAVTASVPISAGETITVPAVPPGTYAIAVRGANVAGSSVPSAPVAVTLPAGCTGVPLPPHRFLAYRDGSAVGLLWEPPPTGPAPTRYELVVSGAYTGVVPMGMQRRLSAPVPPGAYSIAVRAANSCGSGAATDPQVVVVP